MIEKYRTAFPLLTCNGVHYNLWLLKNTHNDKSSFHEPFLVICFHPSRVDIITNNNDVIESEKTTESNKIINISNTANIKKNSRPKGSTNQQSRDNEARKRESISDICIRYKKAQDKAKEVKIITGKRVFQDILEETRNKYDFLDLEVEKNRIFMRINHGILTRHKAGINPPLKRIEPMICDIFIQSAKIGQLVDIGEGFEQANSLIVGTV